MKLLSSPRKVASEVKTLNLRDRESIISLLLYVATILTLLYPLFLPKKAGAAVTEGFVRFDRHSANSAISGTACMESDTTGQSNPTIVFPTDWTISPTPANWTITTTNLPTRPSDGAAATAWPNIAAASGTGGGVNGQSVTFGLSGSGSLTATTWYCFNFAGASSTMGSAGNDKIGTFKTEGGSPFVDSMEWATSIVSTDADQITVTASVSAQLTFSLSGNTATLGTLSSSSTSSASGILQTVSTNARNGWVSWVQSGTDGGGGVGTAGALNSAVASAQIDSPGTYDGTPETLTSSGGYVLDVDSTATCSIACINNEYDGADSDSGGHIEYGVFRETATNTAPTSGDQASLIVRARSSATTPAASDYTDTLTVVAAGSF